MSLDGFDVLFAEADDQRPGVPVAVAGGDDPTVLAALREASDRGWISPLVLGPVADLKAQARELEMELDGFRLVDAAADAIASATVAEVRAGRARMLMKGRIATPALMKAVLDGTHGLRTGRAIGQFVLMELPRDNRRLVLADTGITVHPTLEQKAELLQSGVEVARALGSARPKVALMAATESVNPAMPDTAESAALQARFEGDPTAGFDVQGPLSFDLAYAAEAGDRKRVGGSVVGAAEVMLFPDLLSGNLTVKALMYAADCRFGGVLRGTSAPVVFMSRADSTDTRLRSLALTLRILARSTPAE